MDRIELVEKLKEKAGVSYEEAKNALEKSDWDLLDAIVLLEKEGKVKETSYSTKKEEPPKREEAPREEPKFQDEKQREGGFERFMRFLGKLIHKGNTNHLNVLQHGERKFKLPVTVLVLLLLFPPTLPITIALLIIGLFFGYHYKFTGADLGKQGINKVMDQASKAAEAVKEEFKAEDNDK